MALISLFCITMFFSIGFLLFKTDPNETRGEDFLHKFFEGKHLYKAEFMWSIWLFFPFSEITIIIVFPVSIIIVIALFIMAYFSQHFYHWLWRICVDWCVLCIVIVMVPRSLSLSLTGLNLSWWALNLPEVQMQLRVGLHHRISLPSTRCVIHVVVHAHKVLDCRARNA